MARKTTCSHVAEERGESEQGNPMEGASQQVPETVTREEFTQITANLTTAMNIQQKMMEDLL